jgi:hypothetical protein
MTIRGSPRDSIINPLPPYKRSYSSNNRNPEYYLVSEEWNQIRKPSQLFSMYIWGPAVFSLGLVYNPMCDICKQTFETASHMPCDCETLTAFRFSIFWNRVTLMIFPSAGFSYFVQIAGLLNAWTKGLHITSTTVQVHGSLWCPPLCILFLGSRLPMGLSRCRVCGCLPLPLCMLPSLNSGRQVVFIK